MSLTRAQHRHEAERLLSQASFVLSPVSHIPALDPQVTALLIARAQVHAMLASANVPEGPDDETDSSDNHDSDLKIPGWPGRFDAEAKTWTEWGDGGRTWDLNETYAGKEDTYWAWIGLFEEDGEPRFGRLGIDDADRLHTIEIFFGPLQPANADGTPKATAAAS
jgi:hypothetical protein